VLTRITKYTVGTFLGLSLLLSVLITGQSRSKGLAVTQALEEKARSSPAQTVPAPAPVNPAPLQSLVASNAATTPLATTTTVVNPTVPTNK
jgi:hypothetical protein